jgi:hypothetical protein
MARGMARAEHVIEKEEGTSLKWEEQQLRS